MTSLSSKRVKRIGGLTEQNGTLIVSSGGGIGIPRIQLDSKFENKDGQMDSGKIKDLFNKSQYEKT
jgi:hypothetical protein